MSADHTSTTKPTAPAKSKRDLTRQLGALVVGGLIVAFALLNRKDVEVNWILGTWSTPLIVVIAISFLLGLAGGFLLRGRRRGRESKRR
jgi:uncharacterized integral membrane protein